MPVIISSPPPLSLQGDTTVGATMQTQLRDRHGAPAFLLHTYLQERHWCDRGLIGPDPGIRFNYRIGRFLKSYLYWLPWNDNYYYLQGQGYWVLSNWCLFDRTSKEHYRDIAERSSLQMIAQQRDDGAWGYPNREWKGRVATAEGTWAALGLLESYAHTENSQFLESAVRWYRFLIDSIGFQQVGDQLAVNYFSHHTEERVPNNTAFVLRFLAELHKATHDQRYLHHSEELLNFLSAVQRPNGEIPYTIERTTSHPLRLHFQCYQYNAFQCLDLLRYYEISQNHRVVPLIARMVAFLSNGIATDGHALYECGNTYRRVTYHTAAVAAALAQASRLEGIDYAAIAQRAYSYVLAQQSARGGFPHSLGDYRLLRDHRSYPRYLSMILYHLLLPGSRTVSRFNKREKAHGVVR